MLSISICWAPNMWFSGLIVSVTAMAGLKKWSE